MKNLFDLLEIEINNENEVKSESFYNIEKKNRKVDEEHLKHLEKLKKSIYNKDEISKLGINTSEYIRIKSYVGSRIDTDLRGKLYNCIEKNNNKELPFDEKMLIDKFEIVQIEENIFDDECMVFEDKFLIVDGSSLLSTSFYATARDLLFAKTDEQKEVAYKKLMQTQDGTYTNGVYMFFKTLLPLIEKQNITHIAIVLDRSRNTFRREIDPEYKANRKETPKPLSNQFKLLTEVLEEINIKVFSHCDYEADDFAGSLAKKFEKEIPIYLHTKDEDYIQLVTENTKLWMVTGKCDDMYKSIGINKKDINVPNGVFEYTPEYVKHFKGIMPIQIIDLKAIEGDKSDNIKGVKNVGPTSSVPLVAHYGSLEEIYNNIENLDSKSEKEMSKFFKEDLGISRSPIKNLLTYKEDAFLSKKLATIKTDIEEIRELKIDDLKLNIDKEKMKNIFTKLEMNSLIK